MKTSNAGGKLTIISMIPMSASVGIGMVSGWVFVAGPRKNVGCVKRYGWIKAKGSSA